MNKKSTIQSLVASLLILSTGSIAFAQTAPPVENPNRLLGHAIYFKIAGDNVLTEAADAKVAIANAIGQGQAKAAAANTSNSEKLETLKKMQIELSELHGQLGLALLRQDATLVVAITSTTLFGSAVLGRVGLEGIEKLIAGVERVVPNVQGFGAVNSALNSMKTVVDRYGKFSGKFLWPSALLGGSTTAFLFYLEQKDVSRLATSVQKSLNEVDDMIAKINFVEGTTAK